MAGLIGEANEGSLRSSEVRWLRRGELWDDLFSLLEQTAAQVGWEIFEIEVIPRKTFHPFLNERMFLE